MPAATTIPISPGGIKSYYQAEIESAEILIKTQNLRRLEARTSPVYYGQKIIQTEGELIL